MLLLQHVPAEMLEMVPGLDSSTLSPDIIWNPFTLVACKDFDGVLRTYDGCPDLEPRQLHSAESFFEYVILYVQSPAADDNK